MPTKIKQKGTQIKQKPAVPKPLAPWNAVRPIAASNVLANVREHSRRGKLVELFTVALYDDFEAYGAEAIAACRLLKPDVYVKIIAGLLPREVTVAAESSMTNDELKSALRKYLSGDFAKLVAGGNGAALAAVPGERTAGSAGQVIELSPVSQANGIPHSGGNA